MVRGGFVLQSKPMRQVIIYPDREDGGFIAEVPSLPGCVTDGATRDEAIKNVRDAMDAWIDGARSMGISMLPDELQAELLVVEEPAAA